MPLQALAGYSSSTSGAFCRLLDSHVVFGRGTQVEKQGKASRQVPEHALTRAAMDEDLGVSDKAEVVLSQKLERLFTTRAEFRHLWYVHD